MHVGIREQHSKVTARAGHPAWLGQPTWTAVRKKQAPLVKHGLRLDRVVHRGMVVVCFTTANDNSKQFAQDEVLGFLVVVQSYAQFSTAFSLYRLSAVLECIGSQRGPSFRKRCIGVLQNADTPLGCSFLRHEGFLHLHRPVPVSRERALLVRFTRSSTFTIVQQKGTLNFGARATRDSSQKRLHHALER